MRSRLETLLASIALVAPIAACDSDGADEGDDHADHGDEHGSEHGDGDGDLDPEAYMDRMTKAGAHFEVSLTADPPPPAKGLSTWTFEIEHHMAATEGLTVEVTPFMPQHGHGADEVTVTDDGGGTYTASGVDLFMAGVWDTTVRVSSAEHEDEFHFVFEIEE